MNVFVTIQFQSLSNTEEVTDSTKIVLPAFFPLWVLSRKVNPEIHRVWEFPEIYFLHSQLWQKILGHYFLLVMHKIFWVWIIEKRDMIGQNCLGSPFGALHCLYEWTARPKLMSANNIGLQNMSRLSVGQDENKRFYIRIWTNRLLIFFESRCHRSFLDPKFSISSKTTKVWETYQTKRGA